MHGKQDTEHQIRVPDTVQGETDQRIPYAEEQGRAYDVKGELAKNLRGNESRPAVHPAWPFPNLVNSSGSDKGTLDLVG